MLAGNGQSASYGGTTYKQQYAYKAETTYVAGEFYWQVQRGQKTDNRDFAADKKLLSMERSANELTWSAGARIDSDTVAKAFQLEGQKDLLKRSDATPFTAARSIGIIPVIVFLIVILLVLALLSRCSRCDPAVENCTSTTSRSSGSSYGGSSSGGGHK